MTDADDISDETTDKKEKLVKFKNKIGEKRTFKNCKKEELVPSILSSLSESVSTEKRSGWVRLNPNDAIFKKLPNTR